MAHALSRDGRDPQFGDTWCANTYLDDYYREVQSDEQVTMRFLASAAARLPAPRLLLDFGCGPTVHHLFPFATRAAEIHVADYLSTNLEAVRRWVRRERRAHDWTEFARYALREDLRREPTEFEIEDRLHTTRRRIVRTIAADARSSRPLGAAVPADGYPAVLCCFCPDSITSDRAEWRTCMLNIAGLVARGGWLVVTALHAATSYRVGRARFPSPAITAHDVADVLQAGGFAADKTTIETARVADPSAHGFDAVILAAAERA